MNRNLVLTQVGWGTNARAQLKLEKMVDSDIGNHAFSVGFCRQIVGLTTLALPWHFV